jgi:SNF2 family DNA or RNA helicase
MEITRNAVTATTDGKRILVCFPYDKRRVDAIHQVPGARWHNETKTWRCPLVMTTCYKLRTVFGNDLRVSNELSQWARAEIGRVEQMELLRTGQIKEAAKLDNVQHEAPRLFQALHDRPYQVNGVAFIDTGGQVLLGDDPGLGKTPQALASIIQHDAKMILVACPKTACSTVWEDLTHYWAPGIAVFVAQGSRKQREGAMGQFQDHALIAPGMRKMLVINTEMMRMIPEVCPYGPIKKCPYNGETETHKHEKKVTDWPWLFRQQWDAIILDESHNSLASVYNVGSKNITQVRFGAMQLRRQLVEGGLALAMSGTPFRSKLPRSWGTLNWLRPDVFTSYWRFAEEHFGVRDDQSGYGGREVGHLNDMGQFVQEPIDPEAFQKAMRPYYLARTKATAAPDLQDIEFMGTPPEDNEDGLKCVWVDLDPKQRRAYNSMESMAESDLPGGRLLATGLLAEITRKRQLAGSMLQVDGPEVYPVLPSSKIQRLLDLMIELETSESKVLIASTFTQMVELVATVLTAEGHHPLTLTGKTSDKNRRELVRRFNDPSDECRVAVINTQAGGEAITLDKCCDYLVELDVPWLEHEEIQVINRIHRVSRNHPVFVYRIMARDTVDEWMAGLTWAQRRLIMAAHPEAHDMLREGSKR